jgi:hypothetical protein
MCLARANYHYQEDTRLKMKKREWGVISHGKGKVILVISGNNETAKARIISPLGPIF